MSVVLKGNKELILVPPGEASHDIWSFFFLSSFPFPFLEKWLEGLKTWPLVFSLSLLFFAASFLFSLYCFWSFRLDNDAEPEPSLNALD